MPDIKKNIKYNKEQELVLSKLLEIIDIETLILYNLDNDIDLQNKVLELENDVKKYYSSSTCTAINKKKCIRPYLVLIKFILKKHNYQIVSKDFSIPLGDNKFIRTIKYIINKK